MLVYVYDENTKEYLRTQNAQPNPKKIGEYLMPANSTKEQLPDYGVGFIPVFEGYWIVKPDYRGQEMLNLETLRFEIITFIGEVSVGYQILDEATKADFNSHPECYKVIDNKLVDIRGTAEFTTYLENEFNKSFIETNLGYVRINTAWGNFLAIKPNYDVQFNQLGYLPEGVLILYKKPNFEMFNNSEDVEQWLIAEGQYKNKKVLQEDYILFSNAILARFTSEV